ncbi:MAG: hypothetical protein WA705_08685 [Candidatus Ozemobacteraceae bacterium]
MNKKLIANSNPLPVAQAQDTQKIPTQTQVPVQGSKMPADKGKLNLDDLRLPQTFAQGAFAKQILRIGVGKPHSNAFFRTNPDPNFIFETNLLRLKERNESYLVAPDLWEELYMEPAFKPFRIVTYVTRQGTAFLWPLKLPGIDGKLDDWSQSALEAAEAATTEWTRLISNFEASAYETIHPLAQGLEPVWPKKTMEELIEIGFKGKRILGRDHSVLKELRGE